MIQRAVQRAEAMKDSAVKQLKYSYAAVEKSSQSHFVRISKLLMLSHIRIEWTSRLKVYTHPSCVFVNHISAYKLLQSFSESLRAVHCIILKVISHISILIHNSVQCFLKRRWHKQYKMFQKYNQNPFDSMFLSERIRLWKLIAPLIIIVF